MIYLDANIFIYSTDKSSKFYSDSAALIRAIGLKKTTGSTSSETLQEIIHGFKKLQQITQGIYLCQTILDKMPITILPVDIKVIKQYLLIVNNNRNLESRDCLHLATCKVNKVKALITEDKKLLKVKAAGLSICTIKQALINLGI